MNHYRQMKKLIPLELGETSGMDMEVEGFLLDLAANKIMALVDESFPSSTELLFERWEREYGLRPRAGDSLDARRRALLARYRYIGSMTKNHFVALAAALGYEVDIIEGGESEMFRAGISKAGDRVYSQTIMWTWTVITRNKPPETDIIRLFNDLNPPHMKLNFVQKHT